MPLVALCMIVKGTADEAKLLDKCLSNVADHVDGIFLNINSPAGVDPDISCIEVANKYKAKFITTVWENDFAKARNQCLDTIHQKYDWVLWLDSDDTIDNPHKVKQVAAKSEGYDIIFANYLYDCDEENNPLTVHLLGRLFANNGSQRWKNKIHETLIETRSCNQGATKDFSVIHNASEDRKGDSLERNIKMLEDQLEEEAKNPDPRTFYYLASAYMDIESYERAILLFNSYLEMSGWDQERGAAHTKLGRMYARIGNRSKAKEHFMQAIGEDPDDPDPRVEMGSLELEMKNFHKARHWLEYVVNMEKHLTTLERNPMNYTFRTYLLLTDVYVGIGGKYLDKAVEYGKKALRYRKADERVKEYVKGIESVVRDKKMVENIALVLRALDKNKEKEKILTLLNSIPKQIDDNPIIVKMRNKYGGAFKWPGKSIAIMTGDTAIDEWGPWSLSDGIGGSEEAIIRISQHLKSLGYTVVVFAKPGNRAGTHDGVMWRNYWEANLDDEYDIFIAWRSPFIFDRKIKARKSYLWLHDVMEPGEFTESRIANFTKCIVLSNYHRSIYPMIPDEKILLSGNGIDPHEFDGYEDVKRDPHKMIYASSHTRGLANLYNIWPDVKKAVPDATLDVFYGRESYDAINKGNPERMRWMDDMIAVASELDGVTDHGKVSQERIVRESFMSGIWAYPCPFPEISCITAIKSQAAGAVPVTSNFAALDETVQFGYKQDMKEFGEEDIDKYKESLIWWLQHPEEQDKIREEMMQWARSKSWLSIAEGWRDEFES